MRLALLAAACPCALALPWRRIACMGDSITRGDTTHTDEPEEGKLDRGNYPKTLGALLGVDVANFGASGASVSGKRGYVGTDEYEDAVAFDPDCVVVMLGINDAKLAWDEDDFVEAYADLVEETIADAPSVEAVFVAAPYLAVGTCCDIDMDLVNGEIPDAVAAFVEARGGGFAVPVRFVDARAAWLQATGCDASDVDDACEAYYDDDGMHTSAAGSVLLADLIYAVSTKPRETYGVFGLWRPLSRSDSSRFGSFLDR